MNYVLRVVDAELDDLMSGLPAISLDGPKGVGKTATAQRRARSTLALDESRQRELLRADPERLERLAHPVLIDEWQRLPEVWDLVRRSVDRRSVAGRYLLTGSATPSPDAPVHSGAGRIVRVRMRPLALCERGLQSPSVSVSDLLMGHRAPLVGDTPLRLVDYVNQILDSGLPGIRLLAPRARRAALDGYLDSLIEHEFPQQGRVTRRPDALRRWISAYAAATSTTATYTTIMNAATRGDGDQPARSTTLAYREILTQLWLLDPVPGWTPSRNVFARLQQAPKHHLADPALAARLLGATKDSLLADESTSPEVPRDGSLLGALFESLVTLSLRVCAQACEARVYHLRTRNGDHEVDLIVERADHRVVAVEVKLTPSVSDADVRHLHWLAGAMGPDLLDAVVISTGEHAYRRADGIAVVPLALLGP